MRKLYLYLSLIVVVAFFSSGICLASPVMTIDSATILVGQTTTINVTLSDAAGSGASGATGFNFRIPYSISGLSATNLQTGSAITSIGGSNSGTINSTLGFISTGYFSSDMTPPSIPNGVLASFNITGLVAGVYNLNFDLSNERTVLFDIDGNSLAGTVNGTIHVNAVPIPAAVWLLGSGLVGLVGLRRRMRK
jgi:hypothetical protein